MTSSASPCARCCATRLRSFLTALGIIIGVAAVIAMVAIGEGAQRPRRAGVRRDGHQRADRVVGREDAGGAKAGAGTLPTLTWDDLRAIRADVAGRAASWRRASTPPARSSAEDQQLADASITGTTPEFFEIRNWPMRLGPRLDARAGRLGRQGRRARPDRRRATCSAPAPIRSARPCASRTSPSRWSASPTRKGSRPGGSDYDDVVFVPVIDVPGQDPGRPAEVHPRHDHDRGRRPTTRRPPSPQRGRGAAARSPRHRRSAARTTSRSRT